MISVTISTYERPGSISSCLASILRGEEMPEEIVVVDQSRDARTREAVESSNSPLIRYVHHWPPSISGARNRAIQLAAGEYAAIVDDDCEMPVDWLVRLRAELRRFHCPDVLYGEIRDPAPDRKGIAVSILEPDQPRVWTYPAHPGYMGYGAHTIVRRSAFLSVGGLDERLGPGTAMGAAEDIDLNYRLLKAGCTAVTTPDVYVLHHQWRSPQDLPGDLRRRCYGQAAFCAKHLRQGDRFAARIFMEQVASDVRMLASGVRRGSSLRVRAGIGRGVGSVSGLLAGWRAFAPSRD